MEKQFLSKREFAATLGVHVNTVTNWIRDKVVGATKVGKRVLIPVAELEKLKGGGTV